MRLEIELKIKMPLENGNLDINYCRILFDITYMMKPYQDCEIDSFTSIVRNSTR